MGSFFGTFLRMSANPRKAIHEIGAQTDGNYQEL
jgi:hypothetical protein